MTEPFHFGGGSPSLFDEWFDAIPDDPPGGAPVELVTTDPLPREPIATDPLPREPMSAAAASSRDGVELEAPVVGDIRAAPAADDILARISAGAPRVARRAQATPDARVVGPMLPPAPSSVEEGLQPVLVSTSVLNGAPVPDAEEQRLREMPTVFSDAHVVDGGLEKPAHRGRSALAMFAAVAVLLGVAALVWRVTSKAPEVSSSSSAAPPSLSADHEATPMVAASAAPPPSPERPVASSSPVASDPAPLHEATPTLPVLTSGGAPAPARNAKALRAAGTPRPVPSAKASTSAAPVPTGFENF